MGFSRDFFSVLIYTSPFLYFKVSHSLLFDRWWGFQKMEMRHERIHFRSSLICVQYYTCMISLIPSIENIVLMVKIQAWFKVTIDPGFWNYKEKIQKIEQNKRTRKLSVRSSPKNLSLTPMIPTPALYISFPISSIFSIFFFENGLNLTQTPHDWFVRLWLPLTCNH
jgi:hypothetical protein